MARDSENAIVRPPLWAWASRLCWTATTKYATGRDDDHVAQECLDPPQSLVVIVSGVWCTAGFANIWVAPCTPVDACAQHRVGGSRVLIGRASCARSYGVVQRVLICDNDDRQRDPGRR